jgi:hypothetical protein
MDAIKDLTSRFAWPDVSTEQGVGRACLIGAMALFWIGFIYVLAFINVLSGGELVGGAPNEGGIRVFALCSLGAGIGATVYLALLIKLQRCAIAAWVGFLWIGYEAMNALLAITPNDPLLFLIISFAAFQGVRGCMAPPRVASGG